MIFKPYINIYNTLYYYKLSALLHRSDSPLNDLNTADFIRDVMYVYFENSNLPVKNSRIF